MALRQTNLHPADERELLHLRKDLLGWRHIHKLSQDQLGVLAGISGDSVGSLEWGQSQQACLMSSWQAVAKGLGGQFDWSFQAVPELEMTQELEAMFAMMPLNPMWERMFLMGSLRQLRVQVNKDSATVAQALGVRQGSLTDWEVRTNDPQLPRVMAYVRALGGRFRASLKVD